MNLTLYAPSKFRTIGAAAAVVMACATFANPGIARAESSPAVTASSKTAVPTGNTGVFTLTALTRSALVTNTRRMALRVCNMTGRTSALDEASAMPPFMPSGSSTLEVSYNGKTEQLMPGACDRISPEKLRITTEKPLRLGSSLEGTVVQVAPARAGLDRVSNGRFGGDAEALGVQIDQIRNELKQDDRTARQATAELERASRELRLAARELRGQPVT